MIEIFWEELDSFLQDGGGHNFVREENLGEFSKDFDMGSFFNFDGIEIPQEIKDEAYQKILKNVEDNLQEK